MPQGGGVFTGPGPGHQLRPPGRLDDDTGTLSPIGDIDASGNSAECRVCTASTEDTDPVVIGEDGLCDDCRANAEDDGIT